MEDRLIDAFIVYAYLHLVGGELQVFLKRDIGLMTKMFANDSKDWGSISGRGHTKD